MEIITIAGIILVTLVAVIMLRLDKKVQQSLSRVVVSELDTTHEVPSISIIKPVYGKDSFTAENFRSWAQQDYPGKLQLIYSFQNPKDPAIEIAQSTTSSYPGKVIVNPVMETFSGKMSNLQYGLQAADYDFIVFSDSDIFARPNICKQLVSEHQKGADLISCLMRHAHGSNIWARIFAAFWNFEHMAFIAPSILSQGRDATGGTMAMTRQTLEKIGGLEAFKDYVAEDVAMGRKAHQLGLTVGLGPIVDSPVGAMTLRQLLDKFARAALFGSSMNSMSESFQYMLLFSYLIIWMFSLIFTSMPLFITGLLLAILRVGFASRFWQQTNYEKRIFGEIILSDAIFLLAYFRAIFTKTMEWGGIKYRVLPGGKMEKI